MSKMCLYVQYYYVLDITIFQQDECFCSKPGLEVGYTKSNHHFLRFG